MADIAFTDHATRACAEAFAAQASKADADAYQEPEHVPKPEHHSLEDKPQLIDQVPTEDHQMPVPDADSLDEQPAPIDEVQYEVQPAEPYEEQTHMPAEPEEVPFDDSANPPSPPVQVLPTLSPAIARPAAEGSRYPRRACLRAICGATHTQQWGNSPDGPQTLCMNCYVLYHQYKLVLYQRPEDGRLSVIRTPDSIPMRVVDFALRFKDIPGRKPRRDLSSPRVVPLTNSKEDLLLLAANEVPPIKRGPNMKRKRTGIPKASPRRKPGNYVTGLWSGALDDEQFDEDAIIPIQLQEGEGLYVKAEFGDDMRRFRIRRGSGLEGFKRELRSVFGFKREFRFCVTYQDEEKDFVRVGSDRDMIELFHLVDVHSLKPIRIRLIA